MSCCDEAAKIVIQALGGEEMTKKLVGGTKWWQVRGVKGYVISSSLQRVSSNIRQSRRGMDRDEERLERSETEI